MTYREPDKKGAERLAKEDALRALAEEGAAKRQSKTLSKEEVDRRREADQLAHNFGRRVFGHFNDRALATTRYFVLVLSVLFSLVVAPYIGYPSAFALAVPFGLIIMTFVEWLYPMLAIPFERRAAIKELAWLHSLPFQVLGYKELLSMDWRDEGDRAERMGLRLTLSFEVSDLNEELLRNALAASEPALEVAHKDNQLICTHNEGLYTDKISGWFHRLTEKALLTIHARYPITSIRWKNT
jgi:hypothetical protein